MAGKTTSAKIGGFLFLLLMAGGILMSFAKRENGFFRDTKTSTFATSGIIAKNTLFGLSAGASFENNMILFALAQDATPTITAPDDFEANTSRDGTGDCTTTVELGNPTASAGTISILVGGTEINSNYKFPVGQTTVTWRITDETTGESDEDEQVVTVTDDEKPEISAAADVITNSSDDGTGNCTTQINPGSPTVSDNCTGESFTAFVNGAEIDPSNYDFPIGETTITWTVTDLEGNSASDTQKVTVTDNEDPKITAPATVNANSSDDGTGNCTTKINLGNPTVSDNCTGESFAAFVNGAEIDPSNYNFPIGETIITWTVTDLEGNSASDTQKVTVTDNEDPKITAPATVNANSSSDGTGNCTTQINPGSPTVSDNCTGESFAAFVNGAEIDPSNYDFPIGETIITWTVTDLEGNSASDTQKVTVTDNEDPKITAPAAVNANSSDDGTGNCTTKINLGNPTVSDNCTGESFAAFVNGAEIDPSNYNFPIGETIITWTVTDLEGNSASDTQKVTVTDNEDPKITAPAAVNANSSDDGTGNCSTTVSLGSPTLSDNCGIASSAAYIDGKKIDPATYKFGFGPTEVTWKVIDNAGRTSSAIQKVIVTDNEAPILPTIEDITWGCKYTLTPPVATDNCTETITATTTDPLIYSTEGTYTVHWTFTDTAGNVSTAIQNITIDPVKVMLDNKTDVLCNGLATGTATARATGGLAPYTFSWGSLGPGETKTDLPAGKYTVIVTDANGCTSEPLEVLIDEPDTFIEIFNVKTTSGCFGANNGTATVEVKGGTGNYKYLWSNGQTSVKATGLAPGNHTVNVTDANGCSKDRVVTVSAPTELKITGFLTTETTSFGSATGTATAQVSGGSPNYTFQWSGAGSGNQTGQTAKNLPAGKYTVTVTDANGCTATKEVTILDSLEAQIIPTSICEDEENLIRTSYFEIENLTAKGGISGYTYTWNFGDKATPQTATGPGPHRVEFSEIGDKLITVDINDSSGLTLKKSIIQYVGGCFADDCGSSDLGIEDYFIGDANGNKITAENCADAEQKYLYIYIPTSPNRYSLYVEYIYSIEDIKTGEKENFKKIGYFYEYTDIPDPAQTIPIDYECGDKVKIEGIYLTFTNNKKWSWGEGPNPKCYSTNNEATVSSPLYAVAFPNELLCYDALNGEISVRASGGTAPYLYSVDGGTFQEEEVFYGLSAGIHSIRVKDATGLTYDLTAEVLQPSSRLELKLISETPVTCFGGDDGSATVEASGGTPNSSGEPYIYVWPNGQTTPTATNLSAGEYIVRVLDANGCEVEIPVTITQPDEIPADAGPDQVLPCGNTSTFLQAFFDVETPEGEVEQVGEWIIVNGPAGGILTDKNNPATSFSGKAGTYTLRWTVPCGASDDVKISFTNCSTLDFDGIDDYIIFGNNYSVSGDFTIEAWIKQNTNSSEGIKTIFSKRDLSNYSTAGYDLSLENNYPTFNWNGSTIRSDYPIDSDRWYHLAVITNSTGTKIYVDGLEVSPKDSPKASPTGLDAPFILGATYNSTTPTDPENHFHGWMEEVRIWDVALTQEQLHFMMNQRLVNNGGLVKGEILPMNVPGELGWSHLKGYYYMDNAVDGVTKGVGGTPSVDGQLINITTTQERSAPLPYFSIRNGNWSNTQPSTTPWKYGDGIWDFPNSVGINGEPINWNIVKASHDIVSDRDITLLGLLSYDQSSTANHVETLTMKDFHKLRLTHYLELNGAIDLVGESQLLQDMGSILAESSSGYIERDQQGTQSSFNYNYWSSPVSTRGTANNSGFTIASVLRDGTNPDDPKEINFNFQYHWADGARTSPIKISSYWLNIFTNSKSNTYSEWQQVKESGHIDAGVGFTMKGTSGNAAITDRQNYVFIGKPNNGTIKNTVNDGNDYLIGNPYPSAIDSDEFIRDNIAERRNGTNVFNGTLYFWDHFGGHTHYLQQYVGGYGALNLLGEGVEAVSTDERINATGEHSNTKPQRYIPVGQAFYVSTKEVNSNEVTGGEIIFQNSQRVFQTDDQSGDNSIFTSANGNKSQKQSEVDTRKKIWLKFHSPLGYNRQILVGVDSSASDDFDIGYDAPLIENNVEDMYWMINEKKFVIQGLPDFNKEREIPLGIKTNVEGEFSISIDELKNVPDEFDIYLKDSIAQTWHDLRESAFVMTDTAGIRNSRFYLVFQKPQLQEPENGEVDLEIDEEDKDNEKLIDDLELLYLNGEKELLIRNPALKVVQKVVLYNTLGQKLAEYDHITSDDLINLPVGLNIKGVYIAKLEMATETRSMKFVIE